MHREKLHYIELYKYNFMLIDTDKHQLVNKKYGFKYETDKRYGIVYSHYYKNKNCIYLIFSHKAFKKYSKKENAACIAHEIIHVANFIFSGRDIEFTYNHDEHYAYFVEYLYELSYDFMKKYL